MSSVTNVFLFMPTLENAKDRIGEVNAFFNNHRDHLVLMNDEELGWTKYGGNKHLEVTCAVAAINFMDIEGFLNHLRTNVNWKYLDYGSVQVLIQDEHDNELTMHTIRERGTS